jgi:exosortase A
MLFSLLASAVLIGLFWETVHTMWTTWANVETYSHGYLIAPISLWLTWRIRHELMTLTPMAAPSVLLLVLVCGVGWGLARFLGIQVLEQFAFVAIWVSSLWAILGHRVAWALAFPLLFLFLMVPMGDGLVPPMMEFTADFTVGMLELTGIPVYREGLFFVVPSGSWSVVEACSGVRYLIASATLGLLFAYLNYQSWWRRLAFVLLALLVPILANGLRAYMIVMIGHLSDMRLAVGVDHLIYGWVFFGLVMLLLFWLGSFWTEDHQGPERNTATVRPVAAKPGRSSVVLVALLALTGSIRFAVATVSEPTSQGPEVQLPSVVGDWRRADDQRLDFPLALPGADQVIRMAYTQEGPAVTVFIGLYGHQRQGAEVISSDNRLLAGGKDSWRITGERALALDSGGSSFQAAAYQVTEFAGGLLADPIQRVLAARWYRFGDRETANDLLGKWYQALHLILDQRTDGAYIVVATLADAEATERLQSFSREVLPTIMQAAGGGR